MFNLIPLFGLALAVGVPPQDAQSVVTGNNRFALDLYAQVSGRNVSNMVFYVVFARFKVAVIVQQIYFRYQQGLTKDERFASMPQRIQILLRSSLHSAQTGRI